MRISYITSTWYSSKVTWNVMDLIRILQIATLKHTYQFVLYIYLIIYIIFTFAEFITTKIHLLFSSNFRPYINLIFHSFNKIYYSVCNCLPITPYQSQFSVCVHYISNLSTLCHYNIYTLKQVTSTNRCNRR